MSNKNNVEYILSNGYYRGMTSPLEKLTDILETTLYSENIHSGQKNLHLCRLLVTPIDKKNKDFQLIDAER